MAKAFLVGLVACLSGVPYSTLLERTRPTYNQIPPELRDTYNEALDAGRRSDSDSAYVAYSILAADGRLTLDQRTYFLLRKAELESASGRLGESIATLRQIVSTRNDNPETQYLAELEMAYIMSQGGGSRADFNPSINDMEAQFGRVFSNYDAFRYREETVEAHLEFARECMVASGRDPALLAYARVAVEHVEEARTILEAIQHNPSISNENTVRMLPSLMKAVEDTLQRYQTIAEKRDESSEQQTRAEIESEVVGSTFEDLGNQSSPEHQVGQYSSRQLRSQGAGFNHAQASTSTPASVGDNPPSRPETENAPVATAEPKAKSLFFLALAAVGACAVGGTVATVIGQRRRKPQKG